MGHVRLGRLPLTHRWQQVMDLLTTVPEDSLGIASAVVHAAEGRLRELVGDPSLTGWLRSASRLLLMPRS